MACRVSLAGADDDEDLSALLAETEMDGRIRLSWRRQPSYLASTLLGADRADTVCVRRESFLIGMGSRSVMPWRMGSQVVPTGYLSCLRFRDGMSAGIGTLSDGYAYLRSLHRTGENDFDLTVIMDENGVARRLLERGLPQLPRYRIIADLATVLFPVRSLCRAMPSHGGVRDVRADEVDRWCAFLAECDAGRECAPSWSRSSLQDVGIDRRHMVLVEEDGRMVAGGACWDQGVERQLCVTGYAPAIARLRWPINGFRRLVGRPVLPRPGGSVALAWACPFAARDERSARALLAGLASHARARGIEYLAIGRAAGASLLQWCADAFRHQRITSRLYAVCYDRHDPILPTNPDPEVALL